MRSTTAAATLPDLFVQRVAADPGRVAYADTDRSVTYGELGERTAELAGGLTSAGVRCGDRVALVLSAGVGFVEAFWALQLLGAIPCALNPTVPPETVRRRAERVQPRLVLTDEVLAELPRARDLLPEAEVGPEDLAFMQPTSGTSGEPRVAMLRQRNVVAFVEISRVGFGIERDDVMVSWVPPWHDLGLVRFVISPLCWGVPCHIVPPAVGTIPQWLKTISEVGGTVTGATDFAFRLAPRLVGRASVDLSSLRFATNGGEPVRRTTVEQFEERFASHGVLLPAYGLAEATLGVTATRPGEPAIFDARGNVSCGKAFDGIDLRVAADDSGLGEILIHGPSVFAGYLDEPEATAAVIRDGWLHTGDIGYLDDAGHLYVLGRTRAMLKRGGAMIAPRELEEAAQEIEAVRVAAAVSVPSEHGLTEDITVVAEAEVADAEAAELVAEIRQAVTRTSGFAPERVLVVPRRTIPRTANGKIRHDRLRSMLQEGALS